jgi:transposase InsO family protein
MSLSPIRNVSGNCERFLRTLKQKEINTKEYKDLEDLRLHIAEFIDRYYNQERLHSALGNLPPAEFERTTISFDGASIADIAQIKS